MIRIISGEYRGRKIRAPKNLPVRPTTDRAKEALFNILGNRMIFEEISALELFSGTGNLSYELISRGCRSVTSIDSNKSCVAFIESTAGNLGLEGLSVYRSNAESFVAKDLKRYDLILADPPYDYEGYEELINLIFDSDILNSGGVLVIEHDSRIDFSEIEYLQDQRRYGNSSFSFFGKE